MMISAIGIDPGNPGGIALVVGKRLAYWRQVPYDAARMRTALLMAYEALPDTREEQGDLVFAHEALFIPSKGGKGQAERYRAVNTIATAMNAGAWRQMLQDELWTVVDQPRKRGVLAQKWRRDLGGPVRQSEALWADWAISQVKIRYGITLPAAKEHAADAILIATWAIGEWRVRERMK